MTYKQNFNKDNLVPLNKFFVKEIFLKNKINERLRRAKYNRNRLKKI